MNRGYQKNCFLIRKNPLIPISKHECDFSSKKIICNINLFVTWYGNEKGC